MKFRVVTTANAAVWEQTGRRMVRSLVQYWPDCLPVIVYAEGFVTDEGGVGTRELPAWLTTFKARYANVPQNNGMRGGRYDYRFDCIRFAHKVAALTDIGLQLNEGILVWCDADVIAHRAIDAQWLESLIPPSAYTAWLDRHNSHPESGFVMFRCAHPYHHNFMESLRNLYTSAEIFKLRETHDAFALQHIVNAKVMNGKIPLPASLSGRGFRTSHPFVNGPLGERLDHLKGPLRKANGGSYRSDLVFPRDEPYWRAAR